MSFLDNYDRLILMYRGCNNILKALDSFEKELSKIDPSNSIEDNSSISSVRNQYYNVYRTRQNLYNYVFDYLRYYDKDLDSYVKAKKILESLLYQMKIIIKIPKIESLLNCNDSFLNKNYAIGLSIELRDKLIGSIRIITQASTEKNKSGNITTKTSVETSNIEATDLFNTVSARQQALLSHAQITSPVQNKDMRAEEEEDIQNKKTEAVEQKNILQKLADGTALTDAVNKVGENVPNWLKNKKGYVLRNLILFDILKIASKTPQDDSIGDSMREKIRKKFGGNLGFCDETKDNAGNWVLKSQVNSINKARDMRKSLRDKMLDDQQ